MAKNTVRVFLTNRQAKLFEPYNYDSLIPFWSYSVSGFRFMSGRFPGWNGRIKYFKWGRLSAGLFRATRKEVEEKLGIRFKVKARRESVETCKGIVSDRDYQNECADAMVDAIRKGGGLVLNATGTGKTRIAAMLASRVKCNVCFVVDQLDLLEQAKAELSSALGEEVGYVGNSVYKPRRVTVATVQTIHKHLGDVKFQEWMNSIEILIIDEIHVQMSRRNFKSVEAISPKAVFGLTATLSLKKKEVRIKAYAICGPVVYTYPLKQGIEEGVLTLGLVTRIMYTNSLDKSDGYANNYLDGIVDNNERNAIVSKLARYLINKKGKYVIILVQRIQHLKNLSKRLEDVPHKLVFGEKEVSDRQASTRKFEKGDIKLIIANQVFKKGVDIKRVDAMIDAAGMQSQNDAVQKFGRGVRKHAEKRGLMFFDIADVDPNPTYNKKRKRYVYHSFHTAANQRKRAYKLEGIATLDFPWDQSTSRAIFKKAQKRLTRLEGSRKREG